MDLAFQVIGQPGPQGSKRWLPNGAMAESSNLVRPWRNAVAATAHDAMKAVDHPGFTTGPVRVYLVFWVKPPKTLPKRTFSWPWHRPDLDKLQRATFDALTDAGVFTSDAQVVTLYAAKRYANPAHPATGATIRIQPELTTATPRGADLEQSIARHPAGRDR